MSNSKCLIYLIDIVPTNIGTIWTFGFKSISELKLQFATCLSRFFFVSYILVINKKNY